VPETVHPVVDLMTLVAWAACMVEMALLCCVHRAIRGHWPLEPRKPEPMPLDDPERPR
jgi:hypothetical protein